MRIGIVIAIARELKAFLDSEYEVEIINDDHREVYKTTINNNEIYALKSGYGQIDAAASTQYLITKFNCEYILNFGVTGALKEELKVDDLFVVKSTINYGYDVSPIDPVKKHQYEEYEDEHIPLDENLISLVKTLYPTIKECVVASADKFVNDLQDKVALRELGCDICDMEISAIARTCLNNEVSCLSIKCISDTLYGDGSDFNKNVVSSAAKAFKLIQEILMKL